MDRRSRRTVSNYFCIRSIAGQRRHSFAIGGRRIARGFSFAPIPAQIVGNRLFDLAQDTQLCLLVKLIAAAPPDAAGFTSVAAGRSPPDKRVRELWCMIGRRGAKSKIRCKKNRAGLTIPDDADLSHLGGSRCAILKSMLGLRKLLRARRSGSLLALNRRLLARCPSYDGKRRAQHVGARPGRPCHL